MFFNTLLMMLVLVLSLYCSLLLHILLDLDLISLVVVSWTLGFWLIIWLLGSFLLKDLSSSGLTSFKFLGICFVVFMFLGFFIIMNFETEFLLGFTVVQGYYPFMMVMGLVEILIFPFL